MQTFKLDSMVKGWFVGNFLPTVYKTKDVEAAVKRYKKGNCEEAHCHKIATEVTVIVSGEAQMNGKVYGPGDIIVINPGEYTDFRALTEVTITVVKIPSVEGDKYAKTQAD